MSKIGKIPIEIPENVIFEIKENKVKITGPKGSLSQDIKFEILVEVKENKILLKNQNKKKKNFHGLYRSLINNMIIGVTKGYKKCLEINGIGYKAGIKNNNIMELHLGYSHSILFHFPKEIKIKVQSTKTKNYIIEVEGINKQLVGLVASKIKSLKKKDPYKGKGIYYLGEKIRRKSGKTNIKK